MLHLHTIVSVFDGKHLQSISYHTFLLPE